MAKLEIQYRKVSELIPYARNSRTHSQTQIKQIAASIKEFGFTNAILIDPDGGIIAGHGRCMAAELLELEEVPTVILAGLTESQKRAYVIADNRLALNAGWDEEMLKLELQELIDQDYDLEVLGFDESELGKFWEEVEPESNPSKEINPEDFSNFDHECPKCGFEFDAKK